jgi:hypothetical protein
MLAAAFTDTNTLSYFLISGFMKSQGSFASSSSRNSALLACTRANILSLLQFGSRSFLGFDGPVLSLFALLDGDFHLAGLYVVVLGVGHELWPKESLCLRRERQG